MVEIDLTSADLGRIANQGVDALRIANQNIWEAGSEPPVTYRIWPSTDGPLSYEDDASPYTMGMQFRVTADCALTAIYFWRAPNRPGSLGGGPTQSGDHFVTQCGLFDADTHTLVVPAETFDDPGAAVGWIRQQLDTPITLDTTHVYRVAVYGNWPGYSATRYYWAEHDASNFDLPGPGYGGITSEPIFVYDNDGAIGGLGGQDSFHSSITPMTYPDNDFNAANYWIDIEVTV